MATHLSEATWPEIERDLESERQLVVVMTGSTEQHGPGLPLSVDELRADELGERVADELDCYLAPTVRPGISDHHMAFPGTISLSRETFEAVCRDYCRSLDTHGFEHVALLTTHGGNVDAIEAVAAEMDGELDAHVFVPGDRRAYLETRYDAMAEHGVGQYDAGQHGGAAETSFVMETHPELVRHGELERGRIGEVNGQTLQREGIDAVTDNGVLGDGTKATRAAGRTIVDETVRYLADAIEREIE